MLAKLTTLFFPEKFFLYVDNSPPIVNKTDPVKTWEKNEPVLLDLFKSLIRTSHVEFPISSKCQICISKVRIRSVNILVGNSFLKPFFLQICLELKLMKDIYWKLIYTQLPWTAQNIKWSPNAISRSLCKARNIAKYKCRQAKRTARSLENQTFLLMSKEVNVI